MYQRREASDWIIDAVLVAFCGYALFLLGGFIGDSISGFFSGLRDTVFPFNSHYSDNPLASGSRYALFEDEGPGFFSWETLQKFIAGIGTIVTLLMISPFGRWPAIGEFLVTFLFFMITGLISVIAAAFRNRTQVVRVQVVDSNEGVMIVILLGLFAWGAING